LLVRVALLARLLNTTDICDVLTCTCVDTGQAQNVRLVSKEEEHDPARWVIDGEKKPR
jgi:hypothetical protein